MNPHFRPSAAVTVGHSAVNPGLRGHSCGDFYPWALVAYGTPDALEWRAENMKTGAYGPARSCAGAAESDCREFASQVFHPVRSAFAVNRSHAAAMLARRSTVDAAAVEMLRELAC